MQNSNAKIIIPAISLLSLLLVAVTPASAGVLYNNGPYTGNVDAWAINSGFAVANSFDLPFLNHPFTIQGFDFLVWALPGDTLQSVDWAVTDQPLGGNTYLSGTNTVTQTFILSNVYGYDLDLETFTIPDTPLSTGSYFFQLQNAVVGSGDPIYWDQNDGPSQAFGSGFGDLSIAGPGLGAPCDGNCTYSESFEVLGHAPEPAGFVLLGTGLLGVAALLRRRKSSVK